MAPDSSTAQFTAPCAMGGTTAVDAQANFAGNPESGDFAVAVAPTLVHSGCLVGHEAAGIVFILNGASDLDMYIEISITGEFMLELSTTVDGSVHWATDDGGQGTCGSSWR